MSANFIRLLLGVSPVLTTITVSFFHVILGAGEPTTGHTMIPFMFLNRVTGPILSVNVGADSKKRKERITRDDRTRLELLNEGNCTGRGKLLYFGRTESARINAEKFKHF